MTDDDSAFCLRCGQAISEVEDLEWEVLLDEDGNDLGCVCADCLTPDDLMGPAPEGDDPTVVEVKLRLVRLSDG